MSQDKTDIYALLSLIKAGRQSALETFYEETVNRVFSVALKVTANHNLAEEVVSDVYLQVWRKAHTYDEKKSTPLSWLLMIAYSRSIDAVRSNATTSKYEEHYDTQCDDIEITEEDPSSVFSNKEQSTFLIQAMQLLNFQQRQLINLAFYRGMSHQEIAKHIGIPLGTVKTNLRRAQEILRVELKKSDLIRGVHYGHA